jgi:hypothetical protein
MNKGWQVVRFSRNKPTKNMEWYEEKFEAQDEAERLNNEETNPDTWYGWEMAK